MSSQSSLSADPGADGAPPLPDALVPSPSALSFVLKEMNTGLVLRPKRLAEDDERLRDFPPDFATAQLTGYLLTLNDRPEFQKPSFPTRRSPEFVALRDALIRLGYEARDSGRRFGVTFLAPRAFVATSAEVDALLDGLAGDELLDHLRQWHDLEGEISHEIQRNNELHRAVADRSAALDASVHEEATARQQVEALEAEVAEIDRRLALLDGAMLLTLESAAFAAVLARPRQRLPAYEPEKDFFRPILRRELTSIEGRPYDGPQVSHKLLQSELVEALDRLNAEGREELQALGMWPLRLASAARTPMQQASLTNPVAAPMFSSGHVYGFAFDLEGSGVDFNKIRPKVAEVLAKYGLVLPDRLATRDPNHGFLTRYLEDAEYAARVRLRMLTGYFDAMRDERERQVTLRANLADEKGTLEKAIARLDARIQEVSRRIAAARDKLASLETQRTASQRKLEAKKNEIATKRAMKEEERQRGREWWGEGRAARPDKDDYWERYSREEFHRADGCSGWRERFESHNGERWERGYISPECSASKEPGIREPNRGLLP